MRQRIAHGAEIDAVTSQELRDALSPQDGKQFGFTSVESVLIGNFNKPEPVLMVVPPMRRLRVTRVGIGNDALVIAAATWTKLCQSNEGRLAGSLQNNGANPLTYYLAEVDDINLNGHSNRPSGVLNPGGSSWDFRWSKHLWGGDVTVFSALGTTIAWGEL